MVLAPPDHPLVGRARVAPADLAGEPILLTEPGCNYRLMFERELAEAGVEPAAALEFDGVEAVKQCVVAGMGLAMLPAVTVEGELARAELTALRWAGRDRDPRADDPAQGQVAHSRPRGVLEDVTRGDL